MGFFDKIGKGIGKAVKAGTGRLLVISWEPEPGQLVWIYPPDPEQMIPYASRIVVQPNQAAVIIQRGKILGVLRQGEWPLDTAHVPLLRGIMKELYEGTPLPVRIVFVNLAEKEVGFGGQGKTRDGVPFGFNGVIKIHVPDNDEDIKKFALKIAGEDRDFRLEELEEKVRIFVNEKVQGFLARFYYMDLEVGMLQVKQAMEMLLRNELYNNYYLSVKDMAVNINWDEEWQKKVYESGLGAQLALMRDNPALAQQYIQYELQRRVIDALKEAQGPATLAGFMLFPQLAQALFPKPQQTRQQQAQTGGAAVVGTGPGQQPFFGFMAPVQQGQESQQTGYVPHCPYCGAVVPQGARFCPNCGKQLKWCPNGHVVPADAKFCPVCGAKLPE